MNKKTSAEIEKTIDLLNLYKADYVCDYIGAAEEYMEEVKSSIDDVINALQRAMK